MCSKGKSLRRRRFWRLVDAFLRSSPGISPTIQVEPLEGRRLFHAGHPLVDASLPLDQSQPVDYTARINFGPAKTRAIPGYAVDSGASFGPQAAGESFGWIGELPSISRQRRSAAAEDPRYTSFVIAPTESAWEIAVPNGSYVVRVAVGDASVPKGLYGLSVEGESAVAGRTDRHQRWLETTMTVDVSDGRLTIASSDAAAQNKLDFIDILPADAATASRGTQSQ